VGVEVERVQDGVRAGSQGRTHQNLEHQPQSSGCPRPRRLGVYPQAGLGQRFDHTPPAFQNRLLILHPLLGQEAAAGHD